MIIKTPGGKSYLAKRIKAKMRPSQVYCEPFFFGGSVFFEKMMGLDSKFSPVNLLGDLNPAVCNFWNTLILHEEAIMKALWAIPYNWKAFDIWKDNARFCDAEGRVNNVVWAMQFFVLSRMSRSGLGKDFSHSTRQRRGMDEGESAWQSAINNMPLANDMLAHAGGKVHNCSYTELLGQVRSEKDSLTYLDPPYIHGTRGDVTMYGEFEMSDIQHSELLDTAMGMAGKVLISGYDHPLYRAYLTPKRGWYLNKFSVKNQMSQTKQLSERTECLWRNYF